MSRKRLEMHVSHVTPIPLELLPMEVLVRSQPVILHIHLFRDFCIKSRDCVILGHIFLRLSLFYIIAKGQIPLFYSSTVS
jgi:hypothetical protein